jgi:hypothetical protein
MPQIPDVSGTGRTTGAYNAVQLALEAELGTYRRAGPPLPVMRTTLAAMRDGLPVAVPAYLLPPWCDHRCGPDTQPRLRCSPSTTGWCCEPRRHEKRWSGWAWIDAGVNPNQLVGPLPCDGGGSKSKSIPQLCSSWLASSTASWGVSTSSRS